jgi:hypothetical protein
MNKSSAKITEEIHALVAPTIFFFVALNLIALIRALMLKGTGIPLSTPLQILVAALVLAKAVLIADLWPAINRYPDKPLVYSIAWKTTIYSLVATALHYLEHLVDFWKEAGSFVAGNQMLLARMVWPHFWAIEIVLVVLVLNYCTITELARLIGPKDLWQIFFGPPSIART